MAGACGFEKRDGRPCGANPVRGGSFCLWHDPEHAEDAAEARRLGGLRRRREKTLAGAYDVAGLDSVDGIRRVLEIATFDALSLENSIARSRVLIAISATATKLLEVAALASYGGLGDEA